MAADEQVEIRDARKQYFFMIDNVVIDHYAAIIGPFATLTYTALCRHADRSTRETHPSHAFLAKELAISVASVKRGITKLIEHGLIARKYRKSHRGDPDTNIYIILEPWGRFPQHLPPKACNTDDTRELAGVGSHSTEVGSVGTEVGSHSTEGRFPQNPGVGSVGTEVGSVGATNNTQLQDSVKQDSLGQELKDPPVSTNVETSPKGRERKTRPRNAETEGTRLPKDWQPASTTLQWFHDKDYGTYLDLDETVTEFRNYWHNLPEKNKKPTPYKLDWEATFQNRIIALVKPLRENRQARASPQPQSKQARIEANNLQAHYGFLEMMEREDHERQRQKKL